ncbi:MAG: hypothetical protein CMF50_10690 [Legionellales bacterium]|nr:hypothetical protein [Legionellales bacterium]|tara:strand:- start:16955 stop:19039 length:2085 start_codon:yes stop_codon:yes gene_type:complete
MSYQDLSPEAKAGLQLLWTDYVRDRVTLFGLKCLTSHERLAFVERKNARIRGENETRKSEASQQGREVGELAKELYAEPTTDDEGQDSFYKLHLIELFENQASESDDTELDDAIYQSTNTPQKLLEGFCSFLESKLRNAVISVEDFVHNYNQYYLKNCADALSVSPRHEQKDDEIIIFNARDLNEPEEASIHIEDGEVFFFGQFSVPKFTLYAYEKGTFHSEDIDESHQLSGKMQVKLKFNREYKKFEKPDVQAGNARGTGDVDRLLQKDQNFLKRKVQAIYIANLKNADNEGKYKTVIEALENHKTDDIDVQWVRLCKEIAARLDDQSGETDELLFTLAYNKLSGTRNAFVDIIKTLDIKSFYDSNDRFKTIVPYYLDDISNTEFDQAILEDAIKRLCDRYNEAEEAKPKGFLQSMVVKALQAHPDYKKEGKPNSLLVGGILGSDNQALATIIGLLDQDTSTTQPYAAEVTRDVAKLAAHTANFLDKPTDQQRQVAVREEAYKALSTWQKRWVKAKLVAGAAASIVVGFASLVLAAVGAVIVAAAAGTTLLSAGMVTPGSIPAAVAGGGVFGAGCVGVVASAGFFAQNVRKLRRFNRNTDALTDNPTTVLDGANQTADELLSNNNAQSDFVTDRRPSDEEHSGDEMSPSRGSSQSGSPVSSPSTSPSASPRGEHKGSDADNTSEDLTVVIGSP